MALFDCKRCGIDFKTKQILVKHLNKKSICIAIYNDIEPQKLIETLNVKEGIKCEECNRTYKNQECLRIHKIRKHNISKDIITNKSIEETDKFERLENKINELSNIILEMAKNPQVINNNINHTINNNMNFTLNCLLDTSGKPIEYLLNQENITDKILGWMKLNQKLISTYMKEKYYNKEHPENQMIRAGPTPDSIELYIGGTWKNYENVKGADLILTNIGNDFGFFLDILRSNPDLYTGKKKIVTQFEKDIVTPLNWGIESSETSDTDMQIIKNEKGEFVFEQDEINRIKNIELQHIAIKEVQSNRI